MELPEFGRLVEQRLGRKPQLIAGGNHSIKRIGWCTGAAQSYIEQAAALKVDAFLSGEISEQTVHAARELGIHFIAAGHHATERYGVQAVGDYLATQLGIEHRFIDIDNPV
jgi:putative NIF3 family GTP cyclohydrolase 1 type 2